MEKEKMEQCKARLVEAANWGRKQITPQRLKKGAGCLLALAIVAGGGKFAMHKAKAEAKIQEAQAKTRMLQNMAAQQNITLVSTDAVKENIASTLGTDPSTITFQSITLDDRKPGEKKEDRKDSKKEKKQERKASKNNPTAGKNPDGKRKTGRGSLDRLASTVSPAARRTGQDREMSRDSSRQDSLDRTVCRKTGRESRTNLVLWTSRECPVREWPKRPRLSRECIWPGVKKTACATSSW